MAFASFTPEPLDRSRIELTEDYELRFWTRHFACTSQELLDAIEAVGVDTSAVGSFIAMRKWICRQPTPSLGDHDVGARLALLQQPSQTSIVRCPVV
jgi:hypothetical protein